VSAAVKDRSKIIIDSDSDDGNDGAQSDICRICLNLAFLPMDEGRAFQYEKNKLSALTEQRIRSITQDISTN